MAELAAVRRAERAILAAALSRTGEGGSNGRRCGGQAEAGRTGAVASELEIGILPDDARTSFRTGGLDGGLFVAGRLRHVVQPPGECRSFSCPGGKDCGRACALRAGDDLRDE